MLKPSSLIVLIKIKGLSALVAIVSILMFSSTLIYSQELTQNSCSYCYSVNDPECQNTCRTKGLKTGSGKYENCKRKCVIDSCRKECKYNNKIGEKHLSEDAENCDYCMRKNSSECLKTCNSQDTRCRKRCISRLCNNTCSLPQTVTKITGGEDFGNNCKTCKLSKQEDCKAGCGQQSPGSFACQIACIERACESQCLID